MFKSKLITTLGIILFIGNIHCQQFKNFTIEDIELGLTGKFYPENYYNVQWVPDTSIFTYEKDDTIKMFNSNNELIRNITLDELNKVLTDYKHDSLQSLPNLNFIETSKFYFYHSHKLLVYSSKSNKLDSITYPQKAENVTYNPSNSFLAFTLLNNLYTKSFEKSFPISNDTNEWIVNGQSVHRQEFGIYSGYFWSPNNKLLAYYKNDQRSVEKYPYVNSEKPMATTTFKPYPMAGRKSEEVTLWVYSLENNASVQIKTNGDPEQYLTNITWNNESDKLYIQQLNRGQDTMQIIAYNAEDGIVIDTIYTETSNHYVEPQNPLYFSKKNPENFYYLSRKDGFTHLYKYSAVDDEMIQLTSGNWELLDFYGFNSNETLFYFLANRESAIDQQVIQYSTKTNSYKLLTKDKGVHYAYFSSGYQYLINKFSSRETPRIIKLTNIENEEEKILLKAENPVFNYNISEPEYGTIQAADDKTELHYRLIKPTHLKKKKKYPIVIYVYGGPHVQLLTNSWTGRTWYWQQYLAQNGIASITIDCRGSANRGSEFESVIHKQNGIPQLLDHEKLIEYISELDYIDTSRIGVHGWSFGGFMTTQLILKYPTVFKVGVAGGPVIKWENYEVMYGERYMDTPVENPDGYYNTNCNNFVDQLQGKLLIIHGMQDPVCVVQHSLQFVQSCIKANKQIDYFLYPTYEHHVLGKDRVHLMTLITNYFIDNL